MIPAFIIITPALASAANPGIPADPGSGQNYSNTQTTTDANGTHTTKVSSTTGPDGKVNYRRSDEVANAKGRTESSTDSGPMNDQTGAAGQDYRSTQTTTDSNGTHTTTVDSTMGPDGKVNYSRHTESANADGRTESNTQSGPMNPAATQGNPAPAATPANPMANPAGRLAGAGGAPLIIINTPGAPAGM
ncbi:MAG TPA: hypothetical protein VHV82_13415 [Sporichthyaceae bacterium]|nr:hypothetical protein [Sporichthyaceae bacterium]